MESIVVENNGIVATFSDGTSTHRDRLSAYGYNLALQPTVFKNIFEVGRTEAEIRAILQDPSAVAAASKADGEPTGTNLTHPKVGVSDKGFSRQIK